jgi:hypothetical protein
VGGGPDGNHLSKGTPVANSKTKPAIKAPAVKKSKVKALPRAAKPKVRVARSVQPRGRR